MAKIKIWTTHKSQRVLVTDCLGGVQIANDGTINITLPKQLAEKMMVESEKNNILEILNEESDARLKIYKELGFTEKAFKDKSKLIRLEAYRELGFNKESFSDTFWKIRLEAKQYFDS